MQLGDARLMLDRELRKADSPRFDVLVLDAFSGDAIPAHLLTEEAFKIYLATWRPRTRTAATARSPCTSRIATSTWSRSSAAWPSDLTCKTARIRTKRDNAQAIYSFRLDDSNAQPVADGRTGP